MLPMQLVNKQRRLYKLRFMVVEEFKAQQYWKTEVTNNICRSRVPPLLDTFGGEHDVVVVGRYA